LPIYVDLPLFVAQEKGFFDKRGVQVELKRFETSPNIGTAILTGDVDAGASIATTVALSTESRDPGKMKIFLVDAENKTNYLSSFVVLKESSIKSIEDLKGKKIGGFPGPTATTFGKMVLTKFGLDPEKDVQWIELPASNHLSALESKTVDALFSYEPTSTQAVMEKNAVKLLPGAVESYVIEPWQAGVWVVKDDFLKNHPAVAKNFILAIYDAVDFIRQNPDSAKSSLLKYTAIKLDVARQTPNIPFTKLSEVDVTTLQKYANLHTEKGLLSKEIDVKTMMLPSLCLDSK
jgi:NitT/TauT family transport system substrate-binding protein